MLSKSQFIKKLISFAVTKTLTPSLSSFSFQRGTIKFVSFTPIKHHPFSSFQSLNNNYKDDFFLLQGYSREQLVSANELLDRYSTSQDLESFGPEEIHWIITLLQDFSMIFHAQGNNHKAYSYIREAEQVLKELKIYDTFYAANTHYFKALICMNLDDPTTDIQYHCDEVDRICMLLNDSPEVRSLSVQNLQTRGNFHLKRNEHDKALEFFNQIFEKKEQVIDTVLPLLLIPVYQEMGKIYKAKGDVAKVLECDKKGLEIAIPYLGEYSPEVFSFYWNSADVLYENYRFQEIRPYIDQALQVALKVFPPNHPQIAWCYYILANVLVVNEEPAKGLEACKKAIKIFEMERQEHLTILSQIYFQTAKIYNGMGNPLEAFPFTVESRKLLMMSNDPNTVGICLERAKELGEKGTGEEYEFYLRGALDAYKKTSKLEDKENAAEINFLLGSLNFRMRIWKRALEFLKESEKLYQESSTDPNSLFVLNSLMASLHAISKDYDQSAKYLLKTIEACEANGYKGYHQQAYYYLGKVYHQSGMTEKAKETDEKYRNLCKTNDQEDPKVQYGLKFAQKRFFPIETLSEQSR